MTGASGSGMPGGEPVQGFVPGHASEREYLRFLEGYSKAKDRGTIREYLVLRSRFVEAYPDLRDWFAAPLSERVGRVYGHGEGGRIGRTNDRITCQISYDARPYLFFLAISGYFRFDLEWLVATRRLSIWRYLRQVGLDAAVERLTEEAVGLGYARKSSYNGLAWAVGRIYLHTSKTAVEDIGQTDIDALWEAVQSFGSREDLELFYGTQQSYRHALRYHSAQLHLLGVVLYHRGQIPTVPRKAGIVYPEHPVVNSRMETLAEHYLAMRRPAVRPSTIAQISLALRTFIRWVSETHPEIQSFAGVNREIVLEYARWLAETPAPTTGRPLAPATRSTRLSYLSAFFRDTAEWGWEDVPGRSLLGFGDFPKQVQSVPRYVPEPDLSRLMEPIRSLECPYQRTALLIARWSGARSDEIRRLEFDCLDSYPDGTPRLRIPAGKTNEERMVPLNEEAAREIRSLQTISQPGRGLEDPVTGKLTRYLFTNYGKLFCPQYLFDSPLRRVCDQTGLPPAEGKTKAVSAHCFRHTVGTQMADRGARTNTIMKVLGHKSPHMTLVYAQISDAEVLKDYEAVLGPGAQIAGPLAETLRSGELPASDVEWIKTNFFKTELELGHCLRLPQEGPCECELYLTCAKFVTSKEYAPRLRARRELEFELIEDAVSRGWEREVERHQCTVKCLEQMLKELGEPIDDQAVG